MSSPQPSGVFRVVMPFLSKPHNNIFSEKNVRQVIRGPYLYQQLEKSSKEIAALRAVDQFYTK